MIDKYKDIDKQVKLWVEGKHGRIGFIVPDRKPTEEEWIKLNENFADIIFKSRLRGNKTATENL